MNAPSTRDAAPSSTTTPSRANRALAPLRCTRSSSGPPRDAAEALAEAARRRAEASSSRRRRPAARAAAGAAQVRRTPRGPRASRASCAARAAPSPTHPLLRPPSGALKERADGPGPRGEPRALQRLRQQFRGRAAHLDVLTSARPSVRAWPTDLPDPSPLRLPPRALLMSLRTPLGLGWSTACHPGRASRFRGVGERRTARSLLCRVARGRGASQLTAAHGLGGRCSATLRTRPDAGASAAPGGSVG